VRNKTDISACLRKCSKLRNFLNSQHTILKI